MRRITLLFAAGAAVSLAACAGMGSSTGTSGPPPSKDVVVGSDFDLAPGQSARVDGSALTISFKEVTEDSRCPLGVMCIWAGNAAVSLTVTDGAGAKNQVVLNTTLTPQAVRIAGYEISLVGLQPIRKQDATIPPASYVATLHATRL
jgi:hypothetical protein